MADRICPLNRYSNTLLVSLNNRISIRDTYGARGGTTDRRVAAFPGSACSEGTTDVILSNTEEYQKYSMKHSLPEVDVEDRVISKPRDVICQFFSCPE